MKHLKIMAITLLLASISTQAHASWWDSIVSFFGGEETAEESANADLVKTGLSLLPLLTQKLGVTESQAEGGMGALLQAAQLLLSNSEFSQLSSAIPAANSLMSSAPKASSGGTGDLTGALVGFAAEQSETVKAGTQLVSQFESLGLGADMIPKFSGVAEEYLKKSDKADTASLLTTAISSIL